MTLYVMWSCVTIILLQDKVRYRKENRAASNLAIARAILHGPGEGSDAAATTTIIGNSDSSSSSADAGAGPQYPRCRAAVTLEELAVLMQQAVAEHPYYM
jgi:hypothetical protein